MNMEINSVISNAVRVTIERRIAVDQTLRINPSEAYLGIESGVIKVLAVGTMKQLKATEDIHPGIVECIDCEYSVMRDNLDPSYDEDVRLLDSLEIDPWVGYQYTNGDVYALPLYLFVDHTMSY